MSQTTTSADILQNGMLAEALVHPILFSSQMVQAILRGNKSQTRREIKGCNDFSHSKLVIDPELCGEDKNGDIYPLLSKGLHVDFDFGEWVVKCPYGNVGDILWVRETWADNTAYFLYKASCDSDFYVDENYQETKEKIKWKPSIFMPKKACRLFLKIADIKVQQLNDISNWDAMQEGALMSDIPKKILSNENMAKKISQNGFKVAFRYVWEKINGKDSWDNNPCVWAISFQKCERPKGFC